MRILWANALIFFAVWFWFLLLGLLRNPDFLFACWPFGVMAVANFISITNNLREGTE